MCEYKIILNRLHIGKAISKFLLFLLYFQYRKHRHCHNRVTTTVRVFESAYYARLYNLGAYVYPKKVKLPHLNNKIYLLIRDKVDLHYK